LFSNSLSFAGGIARGARGEANVDSSRLARSIVSSWLKGLLSFRSGSEVIEIARAHFSFSSKTRFELVELSS
jgi:hypothetical protein